MLSIYDCDRNNVLMGPLNIRQAETIKIDWYLINDKLCNSEVMPKIYPLYNEESLGLKAYTTLKNQVSVSPSKHTPHKLY